MTTLLEVKNLQKSYKDFHLGPINFSIPQGSIVGLVGENGSGKTTTIRSILGITAKNEGEIIYREDSSLSTKDMKENLGIVLDDSFFYQKFTADKIEKVLAASYPDWDANIFDRFLKQFSLNRKMPMEKMSKGMQRKLVLATALSHHAELLILDEPTSGLDPVVRDEILDIFMDYIQNESHSIFLSTHITSDLDKIADYIIFLHKGKILLQEDKDTLLDCYGILKCGQEDFQRIKKEHIKGFRKHRFGYEVLVGNRHAYPDFIFEPPNIDSILVFMIRGEQK